MGIMIRSSIDAIKLIPNVNLKLIFQYKLNMIKCNVSMCDKHDIKNRIIKRFVEFKLKLTNKKQSSDKI